MIENSSRAARFAGNRTKSSIFYSRLYIRTGIPAHAPIVLQVARVIPVSSQVGRLYPAEAYVNLNGERRKAMADQITTASKRRLLRLLGALSQDDMVAVARAVRTQLGL